MFIVTTAGWPRLLAADGSGTAFAARPTNAMKMCHIVSLICLCSLLACARSRVTPDVDASQSSHADAGSDASLVEPAADGGSASQADQARAPADPPVVTIGGVQCMEDADCMQSAQTELNSLTVPVKNAHDYVSGECTALSLSTDTSSISGPACQCNQAGPGTYNIGPAGAGCYAYGRLGECLFGDDDFSYCELGDRTACTALCAELTKRLDADAARTHTGEVKYAACEADYCHNVLQVDGHCYADRSYQTGRDYNCSLSGPETIAQDQQNMSSEPSGEIVLDPDPYPAEANATVEIAVSTNFVGTKGSAPYFGGMAWLYSVSGSGERRADIIDPLEGLDDCGVRRDHNIGTSSDPNWLNVETAVLIDGASELPFELTTASNRDFYSYGINLTEMGVKPRFGGEYGFRAAGGTFGGELRVTGIKLPEPLSIHELQPISHLDRGALPLTWTGTNSAPLHLSMYISPQPSGDITYTLECLMKDDGEFTIPEEVMQAVPNGIAQAQFRREHRVLLHDGPKAILSDASIQVTHQIAYGDRCERKTVVDACQGYAIKMKQVYSDCTREPPPLEELCPEYIAQACTLCPEYYACMAKNTTCTNNRITIGFGCTCPK